MVNYIAVMEDVYKQNRQIQKTIIKHSIFYYLYSIKPHTVYLALQTGEEDETLSTACLGLVISQN